MIKKISLLSLFAIVMIAIPHTVVSRYYEKEELELCDKYYDIDMNNVDRVKLLNDLLLEVEEVEKKRAFFKKFIPYWHIALTGFYTGAAIRCVATHNLELNFDPITLSLAAVFLYMAKMKHEEFNDSTRDYDRLDTLKIQIKRKLNEIKYLDALDVKIEETLY